MSFIVRMLDASDALAYKHLRDRLLALHPEAFTSDAQTERERTPESYVPRFGADADRTDATFTLGALQEGRLVGAITCERDPRLKVRHVGHIVGMMVAPEARRLGIGRALLTMCIERVSGSGGCELLTLSVTASNREAVRVYEHCGFMRYGTLPRAISVDGVYYDKDLMRRDLVG